MVYITNATIAVSGSGKGEYAFDLNDATSWKEEGKGKFLEFIFPKTENIDEIDIKFKGKDPQLYDIYYYNVNSYHLYQQIKSDPNKVGYQTFDVDKFVNVTKVKFVGLNEVNEIVDVRFISESCNCCCNPCECVEPDAPVDPEEPKPTKDEGRVKDWGSVDDNPNNWRIVSMTDKDKKDLFKIVDKDGVNVADLFKTKKGAQAFIDEYKKQYEEDNKPEPTPVPTPDGDNVTPDGIKIPYPITGKIDTEFNNNDRNDGKRMDFKNAKAGEYINSAVLGYFAFPKGKAPDDEVSGKWSVENHSGNNKVQCYDMGISIKDGDSRWRFENPHPEYTGNLGKGKENGVPLDDKFVGYMFIRRTLQNGNVALEIWQDVGNNEGKQVSNQWKQLAYWEDAKYKVTKYPSGPKITIRIDGKNVVKDLKLKHVQCVELK